MKARNILLSICIAFLGVFSIGILVESPVSAQGYCFSDADCGACFWCQISNGSCIYQSGGCGYTQCSAQNPCPVGQYCNSGVCVDNPGGGGGCMFDYDCNQFDPCRRCNTGTGGCELDPYCIAPPTNTPEPTNTPLPPIDTPTPPPAGVTITPEPTLIPDGQPCPVGGSPLCASGYCSSGVCRAVTGIGSTCSGTQSCVTGYCDVAANPRVCRDTKPAGASCNNPYECASGYCLEQQFPPYSRICGTPSQGSYCNGSDLSVCGQNFYCNGASCRPKFSLGASCSFSNQCLSGYCNGTCQNDPGGAVRSPNGFACSQNQNCASNNCDNGICRGTPFVPTAVPTNTPIPTATPLPTSTNIPTATPTVPVNTPTPTYAITGNVFIDTNNNRVKDGSEINYNGPLTIDSTRGRITRIVNGSFMVEELYDGDSATISYASLPAGYQMIYPLNGPPPSFIVRVGQSCNVDTTTGGQCDGSGNVINLNFAISDAPSWIQTIDSNMRVDTGFNMNIPTSPACTGPYASATSPGTQTQIALTAVGASNSAGGYPPSNAVDGNTNTDWNAGRIAPQDITLRLTNPTALTRLRLHVNQSPNGNTVHEIYVGSTQANMTLRRTVSQFTSQGQWIEVNFTPAIPNAQYMQIRTTVSPSWVSWFEIEAYTTTSTPGIIFTGDQTATFGTGQSSEKGWVIGGASYPEVFRSSRSSLPLSYASVLAAAQKGGQQIINLTDVQGCSNPDLCALPSNLASGVYKTTNRNMTISSAFTVAANRNIVILVDGTSIIRAPITVPAGSTLTYIVKNDLTIDTTVGQAAACNGSNSLEGFFVSGRNITVEGTNNCSIGADLQLRVGGTFIANANLQGGSFVNNRDLCGGNAQYPSILFSDRPDFVMNAPAILKRKSLIYQEVAP